MILETSIAMEVDSLLGKSADHMGDLPLRDDQQRVSMQHPMVDIHRHSTLDRGPHIIPQMVRENDDTTGIWKYRSFLNEHTY